MSVGNYCACGLHYVWLLPGLPARGLFGWSEGLHMAIDQRVNVVKLDAYPWAPALVHYPYLKSWLLLFRSNLILRLLVNSPRSHTDSRS